MERLPLRLCDRPSTAATQSTTSVPWCRVWIKDCRAGAAVAACVIGLLGCASPPPSVQRLPPAIDRQQVEQMIERMTGGTPPPQAKPAPGGIEVVVGIGNTAPITTVAVSADRRYVLSASFDETIKLWDTAAGQQVRNIPSAQHRVRARSS